MADIKGIKDQLMNKQKHMQKQAVPKKPKLIYCLLVLAGTLVKHAGVLAVGNYLGSSFIVGILTLVSFHYMDLTMQNLWTLQ